MLRIVDKQSTGKTRKLLTYAKENNCVVVCAIPARMKDKAERYGLGYVDCIAYQEYLALYREGTTEPGKYVIDELEKFVELMFQNGAKLDGYDLTSDYT
jgi:hypothetical protein